MEFMKLKTLGVIGGLLLLFLSGYTQEVKYFSKTDLEGDLNFVIEKIRNVQNAPFLYCQEKDFERETDRIRNELPDSMTRQAFGQMIIPLLKMSGDEHTRVFDENPMKRLKKQKEPMKATGLSE